MNNQEHDFIWATLDPKLNAPSYFDKGDKFVLVAEKNMFVARDAVNSLEAPTAEFVAEQLGRIHLVEIEITERCIVGGSYRSDVLHYGYRAVGSDGWKYVCQWDSFDDTSSAPYANWQREFLKGVHYETDEGSRVSSWKIDATKEFYPHYLNWTAQSLLRDRSVWSKSLLSIVNERFPDSALQVCDKKGRGRNGDVYNHDNYGPYLRNEQCMACKHMPEQIIKEEEQDHGTFVVNL
jgi:hypothetical protein